MTCPFLQYLRDLPGVVDGSNGLGVPRSGASPVFKPQFAVCGNTKAEAGTLLPRYLHSRYLVWPHTLKILLLSTSCACFFPTQCKRETQKGGP